MPTSEGKACAVAASTDSFSLLRMSKSNVNCQKKTLKVSLHATLDDGHASLALGYGLDLDRWAILLLLVLQYLTADLESARCPAHAELTHLHS